MDAPRPTYDRERHEWIGQCPHGDVCTGCDARGYCTRETTRAGGTVTERPTHELAADVRAGLVRAFDPDAKLRLPNPAALAALSALVARITDLEAQVAALTQERDAARLSRLMTEGATKTVRRNAEARAEAAEAQVAALTAQLENEAAGVDVALQNARLLNIARDLEAQVAALTQERDEALDRESGTSDALSTERGLLLSTKTRAEAAEAALATARQALAGVAWKDSAGLCWCPGETEFAVAHHGAEHTPRCLAARRALAETEESA